jgi:lysozyme
MLKNEKAQAIHRCLNTVLMLLVVYIGFSSLKPLIDDISGLKAERVTKSEIAQIVMDEGYRSKPYEDSLGKLTVGFGHLIQQGESFSDLTPHKAVEMLRHDYADSQDSVLRLYPWAQGEVGLVLINMTYQLGATGLSEFTKTISYLKDSKYDLAAGEMLNSRWAMQTPSRASRLAGRIMAIE